MKRHDADSRTTAWRSRSAFTLIELLVALAMIAVVLPVTMAGISMAISLSGQARQRTLAAMLAQSKLNELIADGSWQNGGNQGDFSDQAPGFAWSFQTQSWTDSRMIQLAVTVTWKRRGRAQSVVVGSLVNGESL